MKRELLMVVAALLLCGDAVGQCKHTYPQANFSQPLKPGTGNQWWFAYQNAGGYDLLAALPNGLKSPNGKLPGGWVDDGNHVGSYSSYGIGLIHVIAFAFLEQAKEANGVNIGKALGECQNLVGDEITIETTGPAHNESEGNSPKLFFFFQTCMPTGCKGPKQFTASYGFKREAVRLGQSVTLRLTSRRSDWFCFGGMPEKAYPHAAKNGVMGGYGCAGDQQEFESAISHIAGNIGFIDAPSQNVPDGNSPKIAFPSEIVFNKIEINWRRVNSEASSALNTR